MTFVKNKSYYISQPSVVMYKTNKEDRNAEVNHLILGDWVRYLGPIRGAWCKIYSRGDEGWIRKKELSNQRVLEVNFLDIGQGDSVHMVTPDDRAILIDAGKTTNLYRFLQWRYNLRNRKVAGTGGISTSDPLAKKPIMFEAAVISHPDKDHYYGFEKIFADRKISFKNIYHNGIVERPVTKADKDKVKNIDNVKYYDDLGRYVLDGGRNDPKFIYDLVHSDAEMKALLKKHKTTRKNYISTLVELVDNPANVSVKFTSLSKNKGHVPGFEAGKDLEIELLGPITEKRSIENKERECLRKLGGEGVTKNGHSVVMKVKIGKLSVLLGGDLNTESEDFIFKHYCQTDKTVSKIEKRIHELNHKSSARTVEEAEELNLLNATIEALILKLRKDFQVDVAKACHHGSHHFSESFLRALNALAVVISSGDEENYSHPRPDALGAFGKYGRGHRPLIFSTEIARSTREFTPLFKYFKKLEDFKARIAAAATKTEKNKITKEMENAKDSNVARYGMITLRTNGEDTILATKLEQEGSPGNKWDIHRLAFNVNSQSFEYVDKTKAH